MRQSAKRIFEESGGDVDLTRPDRRFSEFSQAIQILSHQQEERLLEFFHARSVGDVAKAIRCANDSYLSTAY
jgi:hypothetical protein